MDSPLFKRGDLVYAKNDTYDITSRSNSYIGLVLNDIYSPDDKLHLMNVFCAKLDSPYHLSLLSDEALTRVIMMVRTNTHVYEPSRSTAPTDYMFRLKNIFPDIPAEDEVSTVWSYFVEPFHFNLLTPEIIPTYLASWNHFYHSTENSTDTFKLVSQKLTRCFLPFSPLPSSSITL